VEGRNSSFARGLVNCAIVLTGPGAGKELTCTYGETPVPGCGRSEHPPCTPAVRPFEQVEVAISVLVGEHATTGEKSGEVNTAKVSGGGAVGIRTSTHELEIDGTEKFGIEGYNLIPENQGGSVDTQAGSHPFQVTSVITANTTTPILTHLDEGEVVPARPRTVALAKDYIGELPVGFVGNPTPFDQCTDAQFGTQTPETQELIEKETGIMNECPAASAIGVALIRYSGPGNVENKASTVPIFNMVPGPGEPARFAFKVEGIVPVFLNASVRTGADYGVTLSSHNIIQIQSLLSSKLTFWGVPGAAAHEHQRGWECLKEFGHCAAVTGTTPPPFLIMPKLKEE